MGLAANVARRGGVYWWRGRIGFRQQATRVIARSLRTRDPEIARALGTQVTGMAALLRQRVRCGSMSIEQAEGEIEALIAQFPFDVSPKVLERLNAERADPRSRAAPTPLGYSAEQEQAMLADFAQRMGPVLERRANEVRTRPPLVLDGVRSDWVAEAIRKGRMQAQVCQLLALSGTSARVRPADQAALAEAGFDADDIAEIDRLAQHHAAQEATSEWSIGPEREVIVFHLQAVGAVPTMDNVSRLRRGTLFVLSDLLRAHVLGYQTVPGHYAAIVGKTSQAPQLTGLQEAPSLEQRPIARPLVATGAFNQPVDTPARSPARPTTSFLALVEALIRSKTQEKSREWDDKTARQHASVAKLFIKNAKTDDPALLTQAHIGSYLDLLRIIPTHYGKSAADEDRSIEEILARSEDLDDDEVGLAPPTINRHRTQLGTILKYAKRHGFEIGTIDEDSRARDTKAPEDKRNAFTVDDGIQLMSIVDHYSRQLNLADRDALFWVAALTWYLTLRLGEAAGLASDDVDLSLGLILIRPNSLRHLKTRSSKRTLPIPPELERLGFREFVARRQSDGCKQLFPGLFSRKSEFAAVFQKMWAPVLTAALPFARRDRKTMHSTRKTGNSAMHVPSVKDATRLYILGHAKSDVNGKHYLTPPSREEMLEALRHIPIVTAKLGERPPL